MATLHYPGDMTGKLPKVLGGKFLVKDATYDPTRDRTAGEVAPLHDPLKVLGI